MADIVNLRQARKRKSRADREAKATENRVAFGLTKAERRLAEAAKDLDRRRLDSHRRDDETP